jgi:transcription factor-like protein
VDQRKNLRERVARLESVIDMLLNERTESKAVQVLRNLGANPLPPTPSETTSQPTGSPEAIGSIFSHTTWNDERKGSIGTDKLSAANIVPPGTSDDIFVTAPVTNSKKKDEKICQLLKEALPPQDKLQKVLDNTAGWWKAITHCMSGPGGIPKELTDIYTFTKWALSTGNPVDVAKVLQFHMSFECGDALLEKYLRLIEQFIIQDDEYMGTLSGVEVCFMQARHYSELGQVRRAWLTARRAISFAQLMGLHRTRVNVRQEFCFWSLFQFDRFSSLMLGSPPLLNDSHCNLTFKGKDLPMIMGNNGFLTRLAIVAGKVIDRVQSSKDLTFTSLLTIDQELTRLGSQMPTEFWEIEEYIPDEFSGMHQWMNKTVGHLMYYETRMVLHLPYLLRSVTNAGFEHSREACLESARAILRIFHNMRAEPNKVAMKVHGVDFISLIAATTLVMSLIGGIRPSASNFDIARQKQTDKLDWELLESTLEVYRQVETHPFGKIASQSRRVLERLTQFRDPYHNPEEAGKIVIPFFGTITVQRGAFRTGSAEGSPHGYGEGHATLHAEAIPSSGSVHMPPTSTLPSQGTAYPGTFGSHIEYSGVYCSPYDMADNLIKNNPTTGTPAYVPSYQLPPSVGWQGVGTFDLDQSWDFIDDRVDLTQPPYPF